MGEVTTLDTGATTDAGATTGDLRAALKAHLDEAGLSIAQAATEIGRRESTISRWLNHKYSGDNDAIEALVARWLETQAELAERSLAAAGLDRYTETGVASEITGALTYAQAEADIVTIIGPSGRGKTRAAEHYCATRSGAFYLAVSGSVFTLPGLLSEVSEAVGVQIAPRSALAAEKAVIRTLRDRNYLLVVDEAHFLRDKLLDELRVIRDRARCGLALVANESIEMSLNRLDQVSGRVGFALDLSAQPVADVEAIAAGPLGRKPTTAELKILTKAARGPGGLHALRRLLGRAFMVARTEGRERIVPADVELAADEGVATDEGPAEAVA
ncbi:MAG: AAA family ATPase [Rhodospirillaceae bacterium]|nr:AAA family ATPase [Rhodospirillaceae bacterium]